MRALFQAPRFRSTTRAGGVTVTSRLASARMSGGDLYVTVETTRAGQLVERVVLQLRAHAAEGVVSVESIRLAGDGDAQSRTLSYEDAVDDDEEYDVYTDTLVSLYQAFFDGTGMESRPAGGGR